MIRKTSKFSFSKMSNHIPTKNFFLLKQDFVIFCTRHFQLLPNFREGFKKRETKKCNI